MKLVTLLVLTALVGGCATYTERTSPCACNWEPINTDEDNEAIV